MSQTPPNKDEETSLEDEDLFEEFAVDTGVDVDIKNEKSLPLWEASWDDEDRGDFSEDLKTELGKNA
eukprot:jgi/Botrbrau1/21656/Bobra.43_1s0056.1